MEQLLGRGSARVTFALGVVLTLPGVAYLAALRDLQQMGYGAGVEILVILGFNVMLLILQRFRDLLSRRGRRMAVVGFAGIGVFLLARAVVGYLT